MSCRAAAIALSTLSLAACTERMPRMGLPVLPNSQALSYASAEPEETTSYKFTDRNLADVKAGFSAAFTDGRTLTFGPVGARRKADNSLIVCGFVSIRDLDGDETGMKVFDGSAEFDPSGTLRFQPRRLAGANGKFLDIYTDCRRVKLL